MSDDRIKRAWLERLGRPVELDFAFFAVEEVYARRPGVTVAAGELGAGALAPGIELEAVGYAGAPTPVRVARIEEPDPVRRTVGEAALALAGGHYGLTLEHDDSASIVRGQCLAPAGRLRAERAIDAAVWIIPSEDWPIADDERERVLAELAESRSLYLFFHTRAVAARATPDWAPMAGREYRLRFELAEPVPLYDGARFGVRYDTLTVGAGFVEGP